MSASTLQIFHVTEMIFMNTRFKTVLLLLGMAVSFGPLHAQSRYVLRKSGIGIGSGFTSYIGKLNTDASLKTHTSLYGTAFYRRRLYHKTYLRAEGSIGMLRADNRSADSYENEITGAFHTRLIEATIKGEYEFLDLSKFSATPYLLAGAGVYFLFNYASTMGDNKNKLNLVIPIGGGAKYKINNRLKVFTEGSLRLFAGNLDNLKRSGIATQQNFYFTAGAGLIYEMNIVNELW